jgi:hypothetical protein
MLVKTQFEVLWLVTPCSEDGDTKILRNDGILPQHYTASQPTFWIQEPGYLSGIAVGYGLEDRVFEFR